MNTENENRRHGAGTTGRSFLRSRILRRGDPYIWFTGSALGVCLLLIGGLIIVVLVNGLGFFWPKPLVRLTLKDGSRWAGEVMRREPIPRSGDSDSLDHHRIQLKVGNRDLLGYDFKWIDESEIVAREMPLDLFYVERREYGPLIGTPTLLTVDGEEKARGMENVWPGLQTLVARASADRARIKKIEKDRIGAINRRIERARLRDLELDLAARRRPKRDFAAERAEISRMRERAQEEYHRAQLELDEVLRRASSALVTFKTVSGGEKEIRSLDLYRVYAANQLSFLGRSRVYFMRLWAFIFDDPRESNTEGGVFPAIFGTVMMVMLMSLLAVPFGVVAALYLREYAKQGPLVRLTRIAVNNLAGVPSIVFGVFGLGFFVYIIGGSIDRVFFPEALPTPTFGTGGILWASLTLGLLTVPVFIVAAEEALSAVPLSMREASYACGATKFQTIWKVVLPAALPGILTGLILAMARGAGEVAPLMITGVVKLAPELPLDGYFPFLHLERKFMHLGFHIYDVGFQSPNVEAAKPMVYTTTILLLVIVLLLNLTAIVVRNRLQRKYKSAAF
jgi:phosphate transport system permease protein